VGGGDLLWFHAAIGRWAPWLAAARERGPRYLVGSSYEAWAAGAEDRIRGRVGFVDLPLLHLDHGQIEDRQYLSRESGFDRLGIDVDRDLVAPGPDAPWSFARGAERATAFMRGYFEARQDDGRGAA
jgi:hypothetical protein